MSVVKGKRSVTKLAFLDGADKLAAYTMTMCSSEKHFPKRYRWCLTSKIGEAAINTVMFANKANAIYPTGKDEIRLRMRYVNEAIAEVTALLALIPVAAKMFNIDLENSSVTHWLEIASYEKTLLLKWRNTNQTKLDGMP